MISEIKKHLTPLNIKIVKFQNAMTQTEVNSTQTSNVKKITPDQIHFIELNTSTVSLEIPSRICNTGHNVLFKLEATHGESSLVSDVTGKIEEIEHVNKKRDRVTIKLVQYNLDVWNKLIKAFSARQSGINAAFENLRD